MAAHYTPKISENIFEIDGDKLMSFINGRAFPKEVKKIYCSLSSRTKDGCLKDYIVEGIRKLQPDPRMPPSQYSTVMTKIGENVLEWRHHHGHDKNTDERKFYGEFKKMAIHFAPNLQRKPMKVVHRKEFFDGDIIRGLLANKPELNQVLNAATVGIAWEETESNRLHLNTTLYEVASYVGIKPCDGLNKVITSLKESFKTKPGEMFTRENYKQHLTARLEKFAKRLDWTPVEILSEYKVIDD